MKESHEVTKTRRNVEDMEIIPLGLLINFGSPTFKEGCQRIVNGPQSFVASRLRVNQIGGAT